MATQVKKTKLLKHTPFIIKNVYRIQQIYGDVFKPQPHKEYSGRSFILYFNPLDSTLSQSRDVSNPPVIHYENPKAIYNPALNTFFVNMPHPNIYMGAGLIYKGEMYGQPCMGSWKINDPIRDIYAYITNYTNSGYTPVTSFSKLRHCPCCQKECPDYRFAKNGVCRFCVGLTAITLRKTRVSIGDIPKEQLKHLYIAHQPFYTGKLVVGEYGVYGY